MRSFAPVRPFFFGPITWISARVSAFGATATGTAVVTTGNASAVEGIALSNVTVDTRETVLTRRIAVMILACYLSMRAYSQYSCT